MATATEQGPVIAIKIRNALPDFLQSVKLKYVVRGLTHSFTLHAVICTVLIPVLVLCGVELSRVSQQVTLELLWNQLRYNFVGVLVGFGVFVIALTLYFLLRPRPVYLVDFACYKPDKSLALSKQELVNYATRSGIYNQESLDFQRKILERSGMGDACFVWKPAMSCIPVDRSMRTSREEAAVNMFYSLDQLFAKTGVSPKDIKVLVVNSSLFNPTPSLSAMVVNRYKMRGDIKSLNLGGMGCSAGVIAIDLAKDLLQAHRNSYAIVCSQEILTPSPYFGNDRAKLVTNCLFKLGGAAVLLSNKRKDARRAKYELVTTVRTHKGADDRCYHCVYEVHTVTGSLL